jgi:DNA repair exonuclease SbcCD ATPase subunit
MTTLQEKKREQENNKNLSDSHMQDYLDNFRRSIDAYNAGFNRYADSFISEMEKSKDAVMKNIKNSVDTITKRMQEVSPIKKTEHEQIDKVEQMRKDLVEFVQTADQNTLIAIFSKLKDLFSANP